MYVEEMSLEGTERRANFFPPNTKLLLRELRLKILTFDKCWVVEASLLSLVEGVEGVAVECVQSVLTPPLQLSEAHNEVNLVRCLSEVTLVSRVEGVEGFAVVRLQTRVSLHQQLIVSLLHFIGPAKVQGSTVGHPGRGGGRDVPRRARRFE